MDLYEKEKNDFEKYLKTKEKKVRNSMKMYEILSIWYTDIWNAIIEYEEIQYRNWTTIKSFKKIYPKK